MVDNLESNLVKTICMFTTMKSIQVRVKGGKLRGEFQSFSSWLALFASWLWSGTVSWSQCLMIHTNNHMIAKKQKMMKEKMGTR